MFVPSSYIWLSYTATSSHKQSNFLQHLRRIWQKWSKLANSLVDSKQRPFVCIILIHPKNENKDVEQIIAWCINSVGISCAELRRTSPIRWLFTATVNVSWQFPGIRVLLTHGYTSNLDSHPSTDHLNPYRIY